MGAGTVDYSVLISYPQGGDRALTYPHAAVEHLGSSQLEIRTFQRSRVAITRHCGFSRKESLAIASRINLSEELKASRKELRKEVAEATKRVVALTRRKLRRGQFQTMQILYGGGGWTKNPYASGIEAAFHPRWGLLPVSQPFESPTMWIGRQRKGLTSFEGFP